MPATTPAAARATMLTHPAPDLRYRHVDYRLAEPGRAKGGSVRYGAVGTCSHCGKVLRPETKAVRLSDRLTWRCVPCAIKSGLLVVHVKP